MDTVIEERSCNAFICKCYAFNITLFLLCFFVGDNDEFVYLHDKIAEWLRSNNTGDAKAQFTAKMPERTNNFKIYILLKKLRGLFDGTFIRCVDGHLIVKRVESEEEALVVNQIYEEEEEMAIEYFVGFSKVIRAIIEAKKPLVGHNLMLDLLFMYNYFYQPLPRKLHFIQTTAQLIN